MSSYLRYFAVVGGSIFLAADFFSYTLTSQPFSMTIISIAAAFLVLLTALATTIYTLGTRKNKVIVGTLEDHQPYSEGAIREQTNKNVATEQEKIDVGPQPLATAVETAASRMLGADRSGERLSLQLRSLLAEIVNERASQSRASPTAGVSSNVPSISDIGTPV